MIRLNVECQHCKHSLLDDDHIIDGYSSAGDLETELKSFYKVYSTFFKG